MKIKILIAAVIMGFSGRSWAEENAQNALEWVHSLSDKGTFYDESRAVGKDAEVVGALGQKETLVAWNEPLQDRQSRPPDPAKTKKRKLSESEKENIELAAGLVAAVIAFFTLPIMANFLTLAASAAIGVLAFYGARGLIKLYEKNQKSGMKAGDRFYFPSSSA